MARIHARRRGKSHSTRPVTMKFPDWLELTPEVVEQLVLQLAEEGRSLSEIGATLRDQYGVPTFKQVTGKKLLNFLREQKVGLDLPDDLKKLIEKAEKLRRHLSKNKRDYKNKHALELVEAKIHRLAKYYKRVGRLPEKWKYSTAVFKGF